MWKHYILPFVIWCVIEPLALYWLYRKADGSPPPQLVKEEPPPQSSQRINKVRRLISEYPIKVTTFDANSLEHQQSASPALGIVEIQIGFLVDHDGYIYQLMDEVTRHFNGNIQVRALELKRSGPQNADQKQERGSHLLQGSLQFWLLPPGLHGFDGDR